MKNTIIKREDIFDFKKDKLSKTLTCVMHIFLTFINKITFGYFEKKLANLYCFLLIKRIEFIIKK